MGFSFKRQLYESLPPVIKRPVAWLPFSLFAGKSYKATLRRKEKIRYANREELRSYQEAELRKILGFATEQVPAYRNLRSVVSRLAPFEALKAFPFLSKQMLLDDLAHYLPDSFNQIPHYECSTGGTSGNQLTFYLDDASASTEWGFLHRMWESVEYTPRHRKATFRGVEFRNSDHGVYWQFNPIYNEIQFSPFHMTDDNLRDYIACMKQFSPSYLHGYPSAIAILANYVLRNSVDIDSLGLRAVLLGSEALFRDQREIIESALGCRAFSWYGHSERIILAGECEISSAYHSFPDYGVLEFIDENKNLIKEDGERGELVGTGLINRCLPLIRYRTEDLARKVPSRCDCGRNFDRFDQVQGRWKQEYVIGKNGAQISPAALNMHGKIFENVVRYQYFQCQPGVLEIRLMVTPRFGENDCAELVKAYLRKVGDELEIQTKIVDEIPLTARGKLRRLIQEIPKRAESPTLQPPA